jgi:cytoskeletal protein CcmA (bactofilin family)
VGTNSKDFSIIDKDLLVEGTLSCKGNLIIRGTVRGRLDGETVIIGKEGAVYAKTKVSSLTVGGLFEGEIDASHELIILSTGKCSGKVVCNNLVIEANGKLNARVGRSSALQNSKIERTAIDVQES